MGDIISGYYSKVKDFLDTLKWYKINDVLGKEKNDCLAEAVANGELAYDKLRFYPRDLLTDAALIKRKIAESEPPFLDLNLTSEECTKDEETILLSLGMILNETQIGTLLNTIKNIYDTEYKPWEGKIIDKYQREHGTSKTLYNMSYWWNYLLKPSKYVEVEQSIEKLFIDMGVDPNKLHPLPKANDTKDTK